MFCTPGRAGRVQCGVAGTACRSVVWWLLPTRRSPVVELIGQAGQVQGHGGAVVADRLAGQLRDLVEPVYEGVAVDVQFGGGTDQVEAGLAPGDEGPAEYRPVGLGAGAPVKKVAESPSLREW